MGCTPQRLHVYVRGRVVYKLNLKYNVGQNRKKHKTTMYKEMLIQQN